MDRHKKRNSNINNNADDGWQYFLNGFKNVIFRKNKSIGIDETVPVNPLAVLLTTYGSLLAKYAVVISLRTTNIIRKTRASSIFLSDGRNF